MSVRETSYRAWDGEARASHRVVLAIAGMMIRRLFRLRLVRFAVILLPLGWSVLASLFFTLVHQGESQFPLALAMRRSGLSAEHILPFMNRWLAQYLGFFAVLLGAVVGSPLIAEDRRARALPLYFSRPISHGDYAVGKFLTLAFYLGLLFFLPPLSMYALDVGLAEKDGYTWMQLPILLRSFVPAAASVVVFSSVSLAVSSLSRRPNYAALLFFGLMMITFVTAEFLARQVFRDADFLALSPWQSARRVAIEMLPLPPQLTRENPLLRSMDVGMAWTSLATWTAAGLAVLVARVRKVEVVT